MRLFAILGGLAIAAVLVAQPALSMAPAVHMAADLVGLAAAVTTVALCFILLAALTGATTTMGWLGRFLLRLADAMRESAGLTVPVRPPRLLC